MARRSSPIRIFNEKFAKVTGVEETQRLLASLPDKIAGPIQEAVNESAAEMAAQAKAIAPTAPDFERHPGELRDSIRSEPNERALSATIIADAKDSKGRGYAAKVEYGHKFKDGHHAQPTPFFWPSYRVTKKRIRSRISRAINKGVKAAVGSAAT